MRRSEREVRTIEEISDILDRCDVIRLGLNGGEAPYIIPMTFGNTLENGKIVIYVHCAGQGRKWEILQKDNNVCIEADLYYKTEITEHGITAKYESVIGTGRAVWIAEKADKVKALKIILEHYKQSGFPVTSCDGLNSVELFRIELDEVSGKHNL